MTMEAWVTENFDRANFALRAEFFKAFPTAQNEEYVRTINAVLVKRRKK